MGAIGSVSKYDETINVDTRLMVSLRYMIAKSGYRTCL
jgi:hypothetical protein